MKEKKAPVFKNYAGTYQLMIESPVDLLNIPVIDKTHWAATSAPVSGLKCDPVFLKNLDSDGDGRIRTDDVLSALEWMLVMLKDLSRVGTDVLLMQYVNASSPEGESILTTCRHIQKNIPAAGKESLSLEDVRRAWDAISRSDRNGDGVITAGSSGDEDIRRFIEDIILVTGGTGDLSGRQGISRADLDRFLKALDEWNLWVKEGSSLELPIWGKDVSDIYEIIMSVKDTIDRYFVQCELVRMDARLMKEMYMKEEEINSMDFNDASSLESRLRRLPLSTPRPDGLLPLDERINPFFQKSMGLLKERVLKIVLGKGVYRITRDEWEAVVKSIERYRLWMEKRPSLPMDKIDRARLNGYKDDRYRSVILALMQDDMSVEVKMEDIDRVERLILYQRWIMELVRSFVSFPSLYDPSSRSMFEMGTLIMDGRVFTFSVLVHDLDAHRQVAASSFIFVMYVKVFGRGDAKDMIVACPVTAGTTGTVRKGKRGIFVTVEGTVRDAVVVDIIENPISIWEAVLEPFKRFFAAMQAQFAAFADRQIKKVSQPDMSSSGTMRDILLGGGIAVAALGSSVAFILKMITSIRVLHILGIIAALAVVVSFFSLVSAFIRLNKRDISVLLEASGWAINAKMKITGSLGSLFTLSPPLPRGSTKKRLDLVKKFARQIRLR